jgi:hypothetical protein
MGAATVAMMQKRGEEEIRRRTAAVTKWVSVTATLIVEIEVL